MTLNTPICHSKILFPTIAYLFISISYLSYGSFNSNRLHSILSYRYFYTVHFINLFAFITQKILILQNSRDIQSKIMTNHYQSLMIKITIYGFKNCFYYACHSLVFSKVVDFSLFFTCWLTITQIMWRSNLMWWGIGLFSWK